MKSEEIDGRFVLGIILTIGAIIIFMKTIVFPLTLVTTILLFFVLIGFLIYEKDEFLQEESASRVLGIAFLISLGLLLISYIIGFGIGGTSVGQACTETYYSITGAQQQIAESFDTATNQFVEETCKTIDDSSCTILKNSLEAGKSLQEIQNIASGFEKASKVIN